MTRHLSILFLLFSAFVCNAAFLNITNFGAWGNATRFAVNTTSNSPVVTTTNQFAASGTVGMAIELFGAGAVGTDGTHQQDMVAFVTNVVSGTNLWMDRPARCSTNTFAWMGANCAAGFQAMVDAASSINTTCSIPAGVYLMIPPCQFTNFVMPNASAIPGPAVSISKGGITFQGAGENNTTLLGCGAWMLKTNFAFRGPMVWINGPVTNDAPLIFSDMTFDGGVVQAFNAANNYWPANTADGSGWDETHDALLDIGQPLNSFKEFRNCLFTHWLGETLKTVSSWSGGVTVITNCQFIDGNASAVNLGAHQIVSCLVSNYNFSIEFYAGYPTNASSFENSTLVNCIAGMVMTGAETNGIMPTYTISGNTFNGCTNWSLLMGPTRNLNFFSNIIVNSGGIITGGAYQSMTGEHNANDNFYNNNFTNVYIPFNFNGSGSDCIENVLISSNIFAFCGFNGSGSGTIFNVVYLNNLETNPNGPYRLYSKTLTSSSQWFKDDLSDNFLPYNSLDTTGITNTITYANGMRQQISANVANSVWVIDDTHPQQVPPGAILLITATGSYPMPLYSSASMSGTPIVLTNGQTITYWWAHTIWATNVPTVPSGLHVIR
jgi:hypothetical protein